MVVQGMMTSCGKAVVVICCDPDGTSGEDALFSTEEVREMISAALLEADIVDANIVVVNDCHQDEEWADKILESAGDPEDPKVWSGKDDVKALFEARGVAVQNISEVPGHVGREIREMIESGNTDWRSKVPAGAMDVIDRRING